MRSVADDLRIETRHAISILSCAERVELALRLADQDIQLLQAARGVPLDAAIVIARRLRWHGRTRSACLERRM